jgi:hypothetical protein
MIYMNFLPKISRIPALAGRFPAEKARPGDTGGHFNPGSFRQEPISGVENALLRVISGPGKLTQR